MAPAGPPSDRYPLTRRTVVGGLSVVGIGMLGAAPTAALDEHASEIISIDGSMATIDATVDVVGLQFEDETVTFDEGYSGETSFGYVDGDDDVDETYDEWHGAIYGLTATTDRTTLSVVVDDPPELDEPNGEADDEPTIEYTDCQQAQVTGSFGEAEVAIRWLDQDGIDTDIIARSGDFSGETTIPDDLDIRTDYDDGWYLQNIGLFDDEGQQLAYEVNPEAGACRDEIEAEADDDGDDDDDEPEETTLEYLDCQTARAEGPFSEAEVAIRWLDQDGIDTDIPARSGEFDGETIIPDDLSISTDYDDGWYLQNIALFDAEGQQLVYLVNPEAGDCRDAIEAETDVDDDDDETVDADEEESDEDVEEEDEADDEDDDENGDDDEDEETDDDSEEDENDEDDDEDENGDDEDAEEADDDSEDDDENEDDEEDENGDNGDDDDSEEDDEDEDEGDDDVEETVAADRIPGFGALAAAGGLTAASAWAYRQLGVTEEE